MAAVVTPTAPRSRVEDRAGALSPLAGTMFDATQISDAIAVGFEPVLKSLSAMQKEMTDLTKTLSKSAQVAADRLEQAARISTTASGLRSPSGMTQAQAAAAAVQARGTYQASRTIPLGPRPPQAVTTRTADAAGGGDAAFTEAYGNSVRNLRQSVASRVSESAQNWAGKNGVMSDPDNPDVYYHADPSLYYNPDLKRWTRNGKIVSEAEMRSRRVVQTPGYKQTANGRWINEATGKFASADEVSRASTGWDTVSGAMRRQRIAGGIANAGQAWVNGEPVGRALMSALPARTAAMVGTGAGIAAAAYSGIRSAAARSQEMYAQGQAISQYTGGSAMEGFRESLMDRLGGWQQGFNFFGPGSQDYAALAGQANQMGMRGTTKDVFVNTGLDLQGQLKMGSEETIKILSSIVRAGDSLNGLDTALKSVTKSAREAGMSTKEARDQFVENYDAIRQEWMYASTQTKTVATGITNAQTALGQGSTGMTMDQSAKRRAALAGRAGMQLPEFMLKARNDPQWAMKTQEDWAKEMLDSAAMGDVPFGQAVSEFLAQNPSFKFDRMTDKSKLIDYLYSRNFDEITIQQILAEAGISAPQTEEAMVIAAQLYTNKSMSAQVSQAMTEVDKQFTKKSMGESVAEVNQWYAKNRGSMGSVKMMQAYAETTGMDFDMTTGLSGEGKGLTALPMVERFMQDITENKIAADGKLLVQGPNGQIEVTAEEAIRYYSDQIQAGTPIIAEGEVNAGKSLSELWGLSTQFGKGDTITSSTNAPGNVGKPVEQTVTIALTSEALRIVKFMDVTGNMSPSTTPSIWDGTAVQLSGVQVSP